MGQSSILNSANYQQENLYNNLLTDCTMVTLLWHKSMYVVCVCNMMWCVNLIFETRQTITFTAISWHNTDQQTQYNDNDIDIIKQFCIRKITVTETWNLSNPVWDILSRKQLFADKQIRYLSLDNYNTDVMHLRQ